MEGRHIYVSIKLWCAFYLRNVLGFRPDELHHSTSTTLIDEEHEKMGIYDPCGRLLPQSDLSQFINRLTNIRYRTVNDGH